MINFNSSIFFYLLLLLPVVIFYVFKKTSKKTNTFNLVIGSSFPKQSLSLKIKYRSLIISILRLISLVLIIIALARPQSGRYEAEENNEARDLMIAVDVSGSMKALDFQLEGEAASRLEVLKYVMAKFVSQRKGDRIGLIVFGTDVFTQCPLTLDHTLLSEYLSNLEIGMAGESTALGDALALSVKRIKDIESKSKAIILVTDGLKTSGQLEPKQAAEIAKELGIKVYTIGIGTNQPAPFPVQDMFGRDTIIYKEVPLDEDTLKLISSTTGGKYFNAKNTDELISIYGEIDKLELRIEKTSKLVADKEFSELFMALSILFILISELCARKWLRLIS